MGKRTDGYKIEDKKRNIWRKGEGNRGTQMGFLLKNKVSPLADVGGPRPEMENNEYRKHKTEERWWGESD